MPPAVYGPVGTLLLAAHLCTAAVFILLMPQRQVYSSTPTSTVPARDHHYSDVLAGWQEILLFHRVPLPSSDSFDGSAERTGSPSAVPARESNQHNLWRVKSSLPPFFVVLRDLTACCSC